MYLDVLFGNLWFNGSMRLPRAYRSLARPSSAPEPSHPLTGVKNVYVSSNPCNVLKRLLYSICSCTRPIIAPDFTGSQALPQCVTTPGASKNTSGPVGI